MSSTKHTHKFINIHNKPDECTFIENENADILTKDIIKNTFLSMEMNALYQHYDRIVEDKLDELCEKLNKKFPQADFDWEPRDLGDFKIIASIKPYKNLTEKRIEKICEMTNTTTTYDGNGEKVFFYFDAERFFECKYNGASNKTLDEVCIKYGIKEVEQ